MARGRKSKYIIKFNDGRRIWRIAIYIRLSSEDKEEKDESNSVSNQRELLTSFIHKCTEEDMVIIDYYIDDGYSGTDFNRPEFMRMLEDIKSGKVNCIIVKDLSRFGRNYIEVGNYLEQILPLFNVRFISVIDEIDSYKNPDSINNAVVPFQNILNEEHCRNTSDKVKAVLKIMKLNGEYCCGKVPYGYKKDTENKYHLVVEQECAKVVKFIFKLALQGNGVIKIVNILNEMKIPSPKQYELIKKGEAKEKEFTYYWVSSQVRRILENEVYCGDTIQSKYRVISYKVHKLVKNKKEEWIIVRNTHEAIIDRETFKKVQEQFEKKKKNTHSRKNNLSLFAGKLKCYDCQKTMIRKGSTFKGNPIYNYYCSTYSRQSKTLCTKHKIASYKLEKMVLEAIKVQIALVINVEKTIKEITKEYRKNNQEKDIKTKLTEEIEENKKIRKSIYEDWKLDVISKDEYFSYIKDYEQKIKKCEEEIQKLDKILLNKEQIDKNKDWINKFKENQNITKLTRQTVNDLIEKVYIHEGENITIVFKYEDEYKQALEFIENNIERSA